MGQIDGSWLQKFFTCNDGINGTREIGMPNTTQEEQSEEFEQFKVEEVPEHWQCSALQFFTAPRMPRKLRWKQPLMKW